MKQVFRILCSLCASLSATQLSAQNVNKAEYFFDTDPGYNNATNIAIPTPSANIPSLSFNAAVGSLSPGMHTLYVRTRAAGKWSVVNKLHMAKVQSVSGNPSTQSNITKAEYFYDNDPGFGQGTNIPVTPATNIASLVFNANVAALSGGMHSLYLRVKDGSGWSITHRIVFVKFQPLSPNPASLSNIVKAEYFYDSDPGAGNGTNIPVTPSTNISSMVFNANVSALTTGMHTLYLRTRDAQGKWSVVSRYHFAKVQAPSPNPNSQSNIVKAEYFYNTDPGTGNGTNIPLTAASDINGFLVYADVSSLPTGLHSLYIRTMDAAGKWSITSRMQFSRIQGLSPNPHTVSNINKAEYFYDVDPGVANGTNIPLIAATNIAALSFNADVSSIAPGMHTMYVRTRDAQGQWSLSARFSFAKVQPVAANPNAVSNIVKAEYFYDNDPGFGNGTDVPVVPVTDVAGLVFNANVTALPAGVHTLYFRSRDAAGKWSMANKTVFAKVQGLSGNPHSVSNITRIEYFVDTDPGPGNGVSVPFTPGTDVSNVTFNVNMALLLNGNHELYIRTKDAQGKWSITNVQLFHGGTMPLSVQFLSFNAKVSAGNKVLLEWETAQEKNVDQYTIERSHNAADWTYVGSKQPLSPDFTGQRRYSILDEQPGTGVVYYRLTELDRNGGKTQAPIRFVRIGSEETLSTVFPNPNDGRTVHISSPVFKEGATLAIAGIDGKIYHREEVAAQAQGALTVKDLDLPSGNYFINLQGKAGSESLKLLVLRSNP